MKQGDRKYEDRIFGHKKNGTGPHRGILGTKKTGTGRHRGILDTKKPAEAGCVDGAPQWTRTTDPHHVKVML